jgi:hypothetical protein
MFLDWIFFSFLMEGSRLNILRGQDWSEHEFGSIHCMHYSYHDNNVPANAHKASRRRNM